MTGIVVWQAPFFGSFCGVFCCFLFVLFRCQGSETPSATQPIGRGALSQLGGAKVSQRNRPEWLTTTLSSANQSGTISTTSSTATISTAAFELLHPVLPHTPDLPTTPTSRTVPRTTHLCPQNPLAVIKTRIYACWLLRIAFRFVQL